MQTEVFRLTNTNSYLIYNSVSVIQSQYTVYHGYVTCTAWIHLLKGKPPTVTSGSRRYSPEIWNTRFSIVPVYHPISRILDTCWHSIYCMQASQGMHSTRYQRLWRPLLVTRLFTKISYLRRTFLSIRVFVTSESNAPAPENTVQWYYSLFWCQLARLSRHWKIDRWVSNFLSRRSRRGQLACSYPSGNVIRRSWVYGSVCRQYECSSSARIIVWHEIFRNTWIPYDRRSN